MTEADATQLRKFGLVVGGIFLLLGALSGWRGHSHLPVVLWTAGAPLVVLGALLPRALASVERHWMSFAHVLGRINTTLILSLLYFLVFTPVGFIRRGIADPLNRRMGTPTASHWVRRAVTPVDPERYRQQF